MSLTLKKGNRRTYFRCQLLTDGIPVPGIAADTPVMFIMRKADEMAGPPAINEAATWLDPTEAILEYEWQDGDTDVPGTYNVEITILWPGTPPEPETWPNNGFYTLIIGDNLLGD